MSPRTVTLGVLLEAALMREAIRRPDEHQCAAGELAICAGEYAFHAGMKQDHRAYYPAGKPSPCWKQIAGEWQPSDPRTELLRAVAYAVAEIERLDDLAPISAAALDALRTEIDASVDGWLRPSLEGGEP